jgi:uncharacterized membrane protein (DUF106 family)
MLKKPTSNVVTCIRDTLNAMFYPNHSFAAPFLVLLLTGFNQNDAKQ